MNYRRILCNRGKAGQTPKQAGMKLLCRPSLPHGNTFYSLPYHYRQTHAALPPLWRIDFVAVELDRNGEPSRIELIENAIGEA